MVTDLPNNLCPLSFQNKIRKMGVELGILLNDSKWKTGEISAVLSLETTTNVEAHFHFQMLQNT